MLMQKFLEARSNYWKQGNNQLQKSYSILY